MPPAIVPPMSGDFTGRVALVTGAARGLGRAAAARLLARGAKVAVNVRGAERAEAVARELGPGVLAAPGDLADPAVIADVVGRTPRDPLTWWLSYAYSSVEDRIGGRRSVR